MAEVYWIKHNTLPPEEWRRFQEGQAEFLKAQQARGEARIWNEPKCSSGSVHFEEKLIRPFRSFYYWSKPCITDRRTKQEIGHWYIAGLMGIQFYFDYQSINYQNQCLPKEKGGAASPLLYETFPEKMKGIMAFDWDQDGDEDLAILLASGRYLFFEQMSCQRLTS